MEQKLNIALLSDVPPDPSYTGGQVLHKIIENTPSIQFNFFWVNQLGVSVNSKLPDNVHLVRQFSFGCGAHFAFRVQRKLLKLFSLIPLIGKVAGKISSFLITISIGFRLALLLRKSKNDTVWMVLQGEKLVLIYLIVAYFSGKRTLLQQWDPIDWWMNHRNHGKLAVRLTQFLLSLLEKKVHLNLVPSEAWQAYQNSRGLPSVKIDNFFLDDEIAAPKESEGLDQTDLHAVFIGQMYSNWELLKLIEILKLKIPHRKIILHYFGAANTQNLDKDITVINHGFLSRAELIEQIAAWDLALLPYPMDEKYHSASTLSFPSKSRVYLAAGLSVLSYCKTTSSPHQFYKKNYTAFYHNAFENPYIAEFIDLTVGNKESRKLRKNKSKELVAKHFSAKAELRPLQDFFFKLPDK